MYRNVLKPMFYLHVCFTCMYVIVCVLSASRGQKVASNPLKLGLQMIVSCFVGAGNRIWVQILVINFEVTDGPNYTMEKLKVSFPSPPPSLFSVILALQ